MYSVTPHLVFTLAKKFLFSQVIDAQEFAYSNQHSSLKGSDSQGHVLHRCLSIRNHVLIYFQILF